jgi:hypothetical protein
MFSQRYHSSTEEESSDEESTSIVSDTPSKATGTDSWHDVKSDTEQPPSSSSPSAAAAAAQQQTSQQLDKTKNDNVTQQIVTKQEEEDDDDDDEDEDEDEDEEEEDEDDDDKDQSLIKSINDIYLNGSTIQEVRNENITGNDQQQDSIASTQEHQIQKEWVNPYWDVGWRPVTTVTQTTVEEKNVIPDAQT